MKYSKNFERDFSWYLNNKKVFDFDGSFLYVNKKGNSLVNFSKDGVSAKEAFYYWDSEGIIKTTKHPNLLKALYKTKGAINFHIKMWAESRAEGSLPKSLFNLKGKEEVKRVKEDAKKQFIDYITIEEEFNLLPWMVDAVENQKVNYYK